VLDALWEQPDPLTLAAVTPGAADSGAADSGVADSVAAVDTDDGQPTRRSSRRVATKTPARPEPCDQDDVRRYMQQDSQLLKRKTPLPEGWAWLQSRARRYQ